MGSDICRGRSKSSIRNDCLGHMISAVEVSTRMDILQEGQSLYSCRRRDIPISGSVRFEFVPIQSMLSTRGPMDPVHHCTFQVILTLAEDWSLFELWTYLQGTNSRLMESANLAKESRVCSILQQGIGSTCVDRMVYSRRQSNSRTLIEIDSDGRREEEEEGRRLTTYVYLLKPILRVFRPTDSRLVVTSFLHGSHGGKLSTSLINFIPEHITRPRLDHL